MGLSKAGAKGEGLRIRERLELELRKLELEQRKLELAREQEEEQEERKESARNLYLAIAVGMIGPLVLLWNLFPILTSVLVIAAIALFFLYKIMPVVWEHRRLKRQQDIDILNVDVSKIGDNEAARLAKKYQGKDI
jgi:Flp pilus assembly protein TadB